MEAKPRPPMTDKIVGTPEPLTLEQLQDMSIALMLEETYGWHEYCLQHGMAIIVKKQDMRYRTVSAWEANNAWRPYECHTCHKVISYTEE